ncbi:unnamed protein product [Schistosoma mattheei]|uniref:Uncharacterized protein n=1 Tax=Schistosoma mattheei TaxID=31246 RepID=A0A183NLT7_9TREM|nr:unnamed protein product [Schistosoma mattheei]
MHCFFNTIFQLFSCGSYFSSLNSESTVISCAKDIL